jgi:16S rRNA (cytidine1402-2'-O)-methyltransferase
LPRILEPLQRGINMGLLSESGCPAVADPGALAVGFAHRNGIIVVPLVGPSSLMLALMASGLNGQRFAFHGYLPVESKDAASAIRALERESAEKSQTQIFIETPYRNNKLLGHLLRTLQPTTRLCVAANLTAPDESIQCKPISEWKKQTPELDKVPATFLFLATPKHAVNT